MNRFGPIMIGWGSGGVIAALVGIFAAMYTRTNPTLLLGWSIICFILCVWGLSIYATERYKEKQPQ